MSSENNNKKSGLDNPAFDKGDEDFRKVNGGDVVVTVPASKERAQWGNGLEFLMSCIAMSVGLGNIWRFPFTAYANGGGAFLIPYIIVLTVIGRPLYYLEMALGQFTSRGNVKMFATMSPVLKGIGYGQLIGSICVATYYCCLMALTLIYFVNSFTSDLPWASCSKDWDEYLQEIDKICIPSIAKGSSEANNTISSSELFFRKTILQEYEDITDGIGLPEWKLTLCLLGSWAVTFVVSMKGVQSSGKASYFLALFPYVIMITLLIRAATLEGSSDGMYYFIKTDWSKLAEADVWYAAVSQCFFSLNVGFGSIIMYSSYNSFDHNINRDAFVVSTLDTFTSLLSGVTIFGILGNLAYELGVTPDKVINTGGTGLAFISYPEAIAKFEAVPWLFAILFFFMLFVLGIGSLVALLGSLTTIIHDSFPNVKMWKIVLGSAWAEFLIGLMYVTPGGQYMLDLVDHFGGTFIIFVFVICEVIAVVWIYGLESFCLDLEYMTKKKVHVYWRITWGVITPVLLTVIFVYFCATLKPLQYGPEIAKKYYPDGISAFGWCILGISVLQAIMWIGYYFYTVSDTPVTEMVSGMFSFKNWGPRDPARREEWKKFKEDALSESDAKQRSWLKRRLDVLIGR